MILCEFRPICVTRNAFKQLKTILCEFGWISATGNPFQCLIVGRNSILNFPAKIWNKMYRALLCCDDSSHSQGQSGKRLLLASKGHPIRRVAYHGSCIDLTHLSHTLNLILKAPGARCLRTIQLLIKDFTAKFWIADISCPWNPLSYNQSPSHRIKSTFLRAEFLTITYGPSEECQGS